MTRFAILALIGCVIACDGKGGSGNTRQIAPIPYALRCGIIEMRLASGNVWERSQSPAVRPLRSPSTIFVDVDETVTVQVIAHPGDVIMKDTGTLSSRCFFCSDDEPLLVQSIELVNRQNEFALVFKTRDCPTAPGTYCADEDATVRYQCRSAS